MSSLLQTLDSDLEPANGIFISSSFRNALQGRSFNFEQSPEVFASEANTTLSSAGTGRYLVTGKAALDHLHSTLQEGPASQVGEAATLEKLLVSNESCFFDGVELLNNTSVQAYQSASVAYGESCQAENRLCSSGALSGTYAFSACTVRAASNCILDGQTVEHGSSVDAYQAKSLPYGSVCESQTRSCENGVLSGSYPYLSCTLNR
jgi:hypothetical protein